jgi:thioredoxin-related protein|tara:strand:+ start:2447 stop:3001 length:555 start_codon:yes stop_codon:yes gene_type:complete
MTKKIIFIFAIATLTTLSLKAQEKINWISLEKAVELQKKTPKKILIDMYTVWCGPCKMLDKNTFGNNSVAKYINAHYYAVKFNAEGNEVLTFKGKLYENPNYNPKKAKRRNSAHQLAKVLGVRAFPTIVFLNENADLVAPLKGYQTPRQLEVYLKLFKGDEYKKINSKEDFTKYSNSFVYEFIE